MRRDVGRYRSPAWGAWARTMPHNRKGEGMLARVSCVVAALFWLAACGGTGSPPAPTSTPDGGSGALHGAGATFPAPFYQKAFDTYRHLYPNVTVAFDAVGSGTGVPRFTQQSVDFGAFDGALQAAGLGAA